MTSRDSEGPSSSSDDVEETGEAGAPTDEDEDE
jgi:hypothetical protein